MFGSFPEAFGLRFFYFSNLWLFFTDYRSYPFHCILKLMAVIILIFWYCNVSFLPFLSI